MQWCHYNASLVEVGRRIEVSHILGQSLPSDLLVGFRSETPDLNGVFEWASVSKCPIAAVDPAAVEPNPALWLEPLSCYTSQVANKLPANWLPQNPTDVLAMGLVTLKGEGEAAAAHKSAKDESW